MKRRNFFKNMAVLGSGAALGLSHLRCLYRTNESSPIITPAEDCIDDTPLNLDDHIAKHPDLVIHYSRDKIAEIVDKNIGLNLTWNCDDPHSLDTELMIDNIACFIAYKGHKVFTWEKPEAANQKTHHPLFYGYPTVQGVLRKDLQVPLTISATRQHPLWHDTISADKFDAIEAYLPKPPAGKRLHEIVAPPAISDPRHISHFLYQKESEKLAYNILHWQPDVQPEGHPYPQSNNRMLLHLMATESSNMGRIGPNAWQKSVSKTTRKPTQDGIGEVSVRYGSYGGLSQMGINKADNRIIGSLADTPFAVKNDDGTYGWAGLIVNGQPITNQNDFCANWQAQMLATVYTQLKTQDYVDFIHHRLPKASSSGAFAAIHLVGPSGTKEYLFNGKTAKDSNGTTAEKYYTRFSQYPNETLYLPPKEIRDDILDALTLEVTKDGQTALDAKYRAENQWRDSTIRSDSTEPHR